MATLRGTKALSTVPARVGVKDVTIVGQYSLAAALAAADIIELAKVMAGFVLTGFLIELPDLDTNGAPTITMHFGDNADPDRYIAASTTGQAGGKITEANMIAGVLGFQYTADEVLRLTVAAGPATGAASGIIRYALFGTYDP